VNSIFTIIQSDTIYLLIGKFGSLILFVITGISVLQILNFLNFF
jgi:hypothetical protein